MKTLTPFRKFMYYFFVFIANITVGLFVPVRIIGRENLPKNTGFVMTPNHVRAIDPMYVLMAYGLRKKMLVMAKAELFTKGPIVNFFMSCFGAFPIERGAGRYDVLEMATAEVRRGRGLLIFPEGTRSKDGALGKLKSGAFVVAAQAGVAMLPCHIHYSAGRPKIFCRTTVLFGAPVSLEELGLAGEQSPKKLREAKTRYGALLEKLVEDNKNRL